MTDEVIDTQVTEPSADSTENTAIADQNAEPAPAAVEEKPKVDAVQRRIDKLTREKYQARAEAEVLRRQLEERSRQEPQPQEQRSSGVPKLEQFQSFDEYEAAKEAYYERKWEEKQTAREREAEEARRRSNSENMDKEWRKRRDEVANQIPDYAERMEEASDMMLNEATVEAIKESDVGPKIAYHLATHPEEAAKLFNLSPSATLRAIGRIEAKIEAEGSKKQISSAPKPIKPVTGSGSGANNGPADTQSTEEWMKARNAQLKRK